MSSDPVRLRPVEEVRALAEKVVTRFTSDIDGVVDGEVHHIGATAMPFGHTKGDVDVNLRVAAGTFAAAVAALRALFPVAQPANWTPTFASFSCDAYPLPLGIQVTLMGSPDDFLLELNERICSDPELVRKYDAVKIGAAPRGSNAYWEAKNDFLRRLLAE
jgi:GrpB-like predicted nucleotidyltransferase (UPF0157 family)